MKHAFNLLLSIVISKNIKYRPENDEAVKLTAQDQQEFLAYTAVNGKSYASTSDFNKRAALWKKNDDFIKANQNDEYELGHNKFSDWTEEEKQAILTLSSEIRPEPEFASADV
jgi:hypothetical protein